MHPAFRSTACRPGQASLQLLRALFGTALDTDQRACCITLPDGSVAYANPAWRKLFGRSISGGDVLPVAGFSSDAETAQRLGILKQQIGARLRQQQIGDRHCGAGIRTSP